MVGLLDPAGYQTGVDSVRFRVDVENTNVVDRSFATPADAYAYFDDQVLNLGTYAGLSGTLDLKFMLDVTAHVPGAEFSERLLVGNTPLTVPEPTTLTFLILGGALTVILRVAEVFPPQCFCPAGGDSAKINWGHRGIPNRTMNVESFMACSCPTRHLFEVAIRAESERCQLLIPFLHVLNNYRFSAYPGAFSRTASNDFHRVNLALIPSFGKRTSIPGSTSSRRLSGSRLSRD